MQPWQQQMSAPMATENWHQADIVAALRKAGWSLRRLSRHYGYSPTVLSTVLGRDWPKGERIIADAIGVDPATIWPERYERRQRRGATQDCDKDSSPSGKASPESAIEEGEAGAA